MERSPKAVSDHAIYVRHPFAFGPTVVNIAEGPENSAFCVPAGADSMETDCEGERGQQTVNWEVVPELVKVRLVDERIRVTSSILRMVASPYRAMRMALLHDLP